MERARIVGACLSTLDRGSIGSFYEQVLGWDPRRPGAPAPVGLDRFPGAVEGASGWLPIVAVDDLPAVAARVSTTAGSCTPLDAGAAVLRDPQGSPSVLCADHAAARGDYDPADRRPGALSWMQLNSREPERAGSFYDAVLGWTLGPSDNDRFTYWRFTRDGRSAHAGMMAIDGRSGADVPARWQVYFHHPALTDVERAIARHGGRVVVPTTSIVGGRFLVAEDPAGNLFGVDDMAHGSLAPG